MNPFPFSLLPWSMGLLFWDGEIIYGSNMIGSFVSSKLGFSYYYFFFCSNGELKLQTIKQFLVSTTR
jgi:hypothetical protein